jgi:regulator of protease activity HflC (stomatin/prohibitin superfamily)
MSRDDDDDDEGMARWKKLLLIVMGMVFMFIIIGIILDGMEVIPAGHKGVIVNSPGGPSNEEINEGYQWSTAYIWADVKVVEYRTQTLNFHDANDNGGAESGGGIQVITQDSVPISIELSIIYHIDASSVSDLVIENGENYQTRIIYPYVRSIARDEASKYPAMDLIGEKRGTVEAAIKEGITIKLAEKYIIVEGVQMRDVKIPSSLTQAIISKKVAEQGVITEMYNLQARQYIANQSILNAQANATSTVLIAEADSNATRIRAVGQAEAVQIILKALNDTSDNATQNFLLYQYIQMLKDPDSNVKFVVVPANGTPLILNTDEKSG